MSLILVEGFDYIPTGAGNAAAHLAALGWSGAFNGYSTVSPGRFDYGNALQLKKSVTQTNIQLAIGGAVNEGIVGIALNIDPDNDWDHCFFFRDDALEVTHITVVVKNSGAIVVYRGVPTQSTPVVLATAPAGRFAAGTWFYLEMAVKIGTSNGGVEVRVNTVPYVSIVSANTSGSGSSTVWDSLGFVLNSGSSFNTDTYFDDLYIVDKSGSINNNFLGNCRVQASLPDGAGSSTTWSRTNTGIPNWDNASNEAINNTQYVYSATAGQIDLYNVQSLINSPAIFGVQVKGAYRQDDATQRVARNVLKAGSTTAEGSNHFLDQSFRYYRDIWELSPDTGISFTPSEINNLQIGPKNQT